MTEEVPTLEGRNFKSAAEQNNGKFSFASYYGDHMVLQGTPKKAVIWGYAPSGSAGKPVNVRVVGENMTASAPVTNHLLWAVELGISKFVFLFHFHSDLVYPFPRKIFIETDFSPESHKGNFFF